MRQRNDSDKVVYVGSTVRSLSERMAEHRRGIREHPDSKIYKLMDVAGVDNFYIELICNFSCNSREALNAEEGRHMRMHKTVNEGGNMNLAGPPMKEEISSAKHKYYLTNREKINAKCHEYYLAHKEELKAKTWAYEQANREKVNAKVRERYHRKKAEREAQAQAATPASD